MQFKHRRLNFEFSIEVLRRQLIANSNFKTLADDRVLAHID